MTGDTLIATTKQLMYGRRDDCSRQRGQQTPCGNDDNDTLERRRRTAVGREGFDMVSYQNASSVRIDLRNQNHLPVRSAPRQRKRDSSVLTRDRLGHDDTLIAVP
jgi:hypothetical protein